MSSYGKTLARVLSGRSDENIDFEEVRNLLQRLGFSERIKGSHHIFFKSGVEEILNLQPRCRHAKPYQVRQVGRLIMRHGFGGENV